MLRPCSLGLGTDYVTVCFSHRPDCSGHGYSSISQPTLFVCWLRLYSSGGSSAVTKLQAVAEFRECVGRSYDHDRVMKREAWHNFIDLLVEEGRVAERQRINWTCPFA